ncbi:type II toxin-antitoxin system Phd/YefM family antitoxin [Brasilonema octagenarum]|jgi:antitoxin (DNA-binding transcriptional repressor) of toxin-antitoxin stability system|uniref:type II toxin-antitoxin system Phd/YefM family antitoxin n=1 Tax=Brasilonema octagenarum TaxID=417105 RepID=UPI00145F2D43|nr:type II toxin-antitoxin system Phd/YefM family antitoxin [Brasilonema octagenarum]
MQRVTVDDIKPDPLKYLNQVEAGESFVIIQADKAIAELKPITSTNKQLRPFGLCAGEFTVPDDFDEPLPEDSLRGYRVHTGTLKTSPSLLVSLSLIRRGMPDRAG